MCDPSLISSSPLRLHAATGPGTQVQAMCLRRSAKCRCLTDQMPNVRYDEGHLLFEATDREKYQVKLQVSLSSGLPLFPLAASASASSAVMMQRHQVGFASPAWLPSCRGNEPSLHAP